jgi:hypothetical protein
MPEVALNSPSPGSSSPSRFPLLLVGAVSAVLIVATLALWANYGTTVFFEIIAAGIAACF